MWELIKKLIIFAIGLYFIMFFARVIFNNFSITNIAKDFTSALGEFRTLGQNGSNKSILGDSSNQKATTTKYTKTSTGAASAVTFTNISSGNMVSVKEPVLGNIKSTWLFEGVTSALFLDEEGKQIGVAQVVADGLAGPNADMVPFSIYPQFNQGNAKTGFIVVEKVNTTGKSSSDAWVTMRITYPVNTSPVQTSPSSSNSNDYTIVSGTSTGGVTTFSDTRNN